MNPGAYFHFPSRGSWRGVMWPSLVALLFTALSVLSFAVDQGIALSTVLDLTGLDAGH